MYFDYCPTRKDAESLRPIAPGITPDGQYLGMAAVPNLTLPANTSDQGYSPRTAQGTTEMNNNTEKAPGMPHDVPMMYGQQNMRFLQVAGYGNYPSNQGYVYRGYPWVWSGVIRDRNMMGHVPAIYENIQPQVQPQPQDGYGAGMQNNRTMMERAEQPSRDYTYNQSAQTLGQNWMHQGSGY